MIKIFLIYIFFICLGILSKVQGDCYSIFSNLVYLQVIDARECELIRYSDRNTFCNNRDSLRNPDPTINALPVDCIETYTYVLGSILKDEKGYSLASSDDHKAIYVGGIKGDSAVIIKINYSGKLDWVRALDIVPGKQDHMMRILVDSEGMIAGSGIAGTTNAGGTVFVFRYNPVSNILLWSTEIRSTGTNYNNGLIQKGAGGNYLMINNPQSPNNVLEIIEINKNTGTLNNQISKHYDLTSSESLGDALYHNGKIYGTGRFSFSPSNSSYRHTLLRLNGDNGNFEWCFLGHKGNPGIARLYGAGLVLDQDFIYSVYCGDEDGTSIDQTNIFVQKTTEDGGFVWLNRYNIPGANDWADEIIKSGNGFVILCRSRTAPSDIILFKINDQGSVLWAKKFDYTNNDNGVPIGSSQSQLLEADQHLYFTAFSESSVSADMVIVKTDLDGNINDTCIVMTPLNLVAENIPQITWFSMEPDVTDYSPTVIILSPAVVNSTNIQTNTICQTSNSVSVEHIVQAEICMGDNYEGYSSSGQYIDHFISHDGCDSARILNLLVTDAILTFKNMEICYGDSVNGYSESGIYLDTFISYFGCDSIQTLILNIGKPITTDIEANLCADHQSGYVSVGRYVDTLQSNNGCDSIRTINITGVSKYIPNVFSPNDDGVNDLFMVFQFPDNSLDFKYFGIYDRFGDMTYETDQWPIQWDGKSSGGHSFPPGVFAYILIYHCGEKRILEHGNITVIK